MSQTVTKEQVEEAFQSIEPSIFVDEVNKAYIEKAIIESLFPPPFEPKPGQVIAVRDSEDNDWEFDVYESPFPEMASGWDEGIRFDCKMSHWKFARSLTPTELGE